jgi:hypothetical protein
VTTKKRLVLAVLAGTMVMFVWGAVSHMVLFKGAGFSRLPNEDRVMAELRKSVKSDGLYFFPSPDFSGSATPAETLAWEAKFRAGPTGMIVYHPSGSAPMSAKKLLIQFLSHLMGAVVATFIASRVTGSFWTRVLVTGLLGAFGPLTLGTIFWNWYGFPSAFFLAQWADMVVGWSLAGIAIAAVLKRVLLPSRALAHNSPPSGSSGGQPSR